jgi:hypothetical protein
MLLAGWTLGGFAPHLESRAGGIPAASARQDAPQATPDPSPVPTLSINPRWVEGQRVLLMVDLAPTSWKIEFERGSWPYFIRVNGVEYSSGGGFSVFEPTRKHCYIDLLSLNSSRPLYWSPGEYRVALVVRNFEARSRRDPTLVVHHNAMATSEVRFRIVARDSNEGRALRAGAVYEGKTIEEWFVECAATAMDDKQRALQILAKIGKPAIPGLMELLEHNDPRAYYASQALGSMGDAAREVLTRLLALAGDQAAVRPDALGEARGVRLNAMFALGRMVWAAAEIVPALERVAGSEAEPVENRSAATMAMRDLGPPAQAALALLQLSANDEVQRRAAEAMVETLPAGGRSRQQLYEELITKDPLDVNVPLYLTQSKDSASSDGCLGRSHPLSDRIKELYRERLATRPDPRLALGLARIIQTQLTATYLEWVIHSDTMHGQCQREAPDESFATLAEALTAAFEHSDHDMALHRLLGIALAKTCLLRGDWDGMNAMLVRLGQMPIPAGERPRLHAPPVDWSNLRRNWREAAPAMRSGTCGLELHFEKDGRGLAGVHVLVKKAPPHTNVLVTGIAADTIFLSPFPLAADHFESFGYKYDGDRDRTRYGVSDATGVVRFEGLPQVVPTIEILVPTGNFTEPGHDWELLWRKGSNQLLTRPAPWGDLDDVVLIPGTTVRYPTLVVRAIGPACF